MSGNTFGELFRVTTYGESHGSAIGAVIDGCPAGLYIPDDFIAAEMARRRPGQSALTTSRQEQDQVQITSGIFEQHTTGAPIHLQILNTDQRSGDYDTLKHTYRPSHADYTYDVKYGIRDHRGGGRSSARLTAPMVAAGAIAKLLLQQGHMQIRAYVSQVYTEVLDIPYSQLNLDMTEQSPVRCPDPETSVRMQQLIEQAKAEGDSLGGVITAVVSGMAPGLGEPLFGKLESKLAAAMLAINAIKGFEIGSGFAGSAMKGSQHNDAFTRDEAGNISTVTNHSGGVQGGISNGEDLWFRVAFKPTATISASQDTVTVSGEKTVLNAAGRHDPCVLPRAVPIVEAYTALVLADCLLLNQTSRLAQLLFR